MHHSKTNLKDNHMNFVSDYKGFKIAKFNGTSWGVCGYPKTTYANKEVCQRVIDTYLYANEITEKEHPKQIENMQKVKFTRPEAVYSNKNHFEDYEIAS